jgi:Heterokaryon incompatibility protein (HET)
MDSYRYEPITGDPMGLSLVKILASPNLEDPLSLELSTASLSEPSKYIALLYTWGSPYEGLPPKWDDPDFLLSILVSEKSFRVRQNLYIALRHLRASRYSETLWWVDASASTKMTLPKRAKNIENEARLRKVSGNSNLIGTSHNVLRNRYNKDPGACRPLGEAL